MKRNLLTLRGAQRHRGARKCACQYFQERKLVPVVEGNFFLEIPCENFFWNFFVDSDGIFFTYSIHFVHIHNPVKAHSRRFCGSFRIFVVGFRALGFFTNHTQIIHSSISRLEGEQEIFPVKEK